MEKTLGSIAIVAGWCSIMAGVVVGVAASSYFGLAEGSDIQTRVNVYNINAAVFVTIFLAAAVLTAGALRHWILAPDPQPSLRLLAIGMAVVGIVLLPDELGRAFGLPLFGGAVAIWLGGELLPRQIATSESTAGLSEAASGDAAPADPTPMPPSVNGSAPVSSSLAAEPTSAWALSGPPEPTTPTAAPAGATKRRGSGLPEKAPDRICPWCSSPVPTSAASCPNCHAALDETATGETPIPGVTVVPPELRRYAEQAGTKKRKENLITILFHEDSAPTTQYAPPPSDAAALQPPSPEVKAAMARLDAEIAAGVVASDAAVDPPDAAAAEPPDAAAEPPDAGDPTQSADPPGHG